ncbi:MAG: type II/IV secretion system ATPase subunit [Candidatus Methanoperedens sp.]|nr:type II/IV secretion system ATPase subunit [Candidatus Methanoperedens sp.]CAG0976391.1 Type IV secretion system protein PtlH [Methanosarcinales archaeon]
MSVKKEDQKTGQRSIQMLENVKIRLEKIKLPKLNFNKDETLPCETEVERIQPYDVAVHGDIVTFQGLPGYVELERYWVNEPFSFISIQFNKSNDDYVYCIVEPELTPFETTLIHDIYERSRDLLSYDDLVDGADKKDILTRTVKKIIDNYILNFDVKSFHKILYFMIRNNIGFSRIDPLIRDDKIEDISCSGPNIPVYLYHRKYENIKTNIIFEEEELNSFIFLLAQRSGKNISVAKPYLDATLTDGSRLQETLGREITTRGSSFTIRKFKETPITPIDLIKWGTFNVEMMAYLWLAIENNKSLILAGGTASGKTTSLNAISLFIPHKSKIVTLEDTRELQLFHENWVAGLTRDSFTAGGKGAVDMYELLRQGLRQRPEYLIVGEVRGKEALTLFQAMSTGHTTYSTMHAGSVQAAINRLENDPINVPRVMITALDILCVQGAIFTEGKRVRRILNVIEILDLDPESKSLNTLETFTWDPINDDHNVLRESEVMETIKEKRGWNKKQLEQALNRRQKVLSYMVEKNIRDYDSVVTIIKDFQINQERLMKKLMIEDE